MIGAKAFQEAQQASQNDGKKNQSRKCCVVSISKKKRKTNFYGIDESAILQCTY